MLLHRALIALRAVSVAVRGPSQHRAVIWTGSGQPIINPESYFGQPKNDRWGNLREKPDEFTDWEKADAHTQHSF